MQVYNDLVYKCEKYKYFIKLKFVWQCIWDLYYRRIRKKKKEEAL